MITKAEAVMAALDVNFIPANCCVHCRQVKMNFVASAFNPRGERKGVCAKCGQGGNTFARSPYQDTLLRIRAGYYD